MWCRPRRDVAEAVTNLLAGVERRVGNLAGGEHPDGIAGDPGDSDEIRPGLHNTARAAGHLTRATLQGHRRVRHVGKVGLTRSICEQRQPFGSITIEQGDGGAGCSTGDRQRLHPRAERQACCGIDAARSRQDPVVWERGRTPHRWVAPRRWRGARRSTAPMPERPTPAASSPTRRQHPISANPPASPLDLCHPAHHGYHLTPEGGTRFE